MLFPRRWTIADGQYGGFEALVDLTVPFAIGNFGGGFYRARGSLVEPGAQYHWVGWPSETLPIPVYFPSVRRVLYGGSDTLSVLIAHSASDSIAFWQAVDDFQGRFGTTLFRPAVQSELEYVRHLCDPTGVCWPIYANALEARLTHGFRAITGRTEFGWSSSSLSIASQPALEWGYVHVDPSELSAPSIDLAHALMHLLGFDHACFPSATERCFGDFPYQDLPVPAGDSAGTVWDVFYATLNQAAWNRAQEQGSNLGIQAALHGQVFLEMGSDVPGWWRDRRGFGPTTSNPR